MRVSSNDEKPSEMAIFAILSPVRLPFRHTGKPMSTIVECISEKEYLTSRCFNAMERNASQRSSDCCKSTRANVRFHAATFAKVPAGRKQPVRGLGQRGGAILRAVQH